MPTPLVPQEIYLLERYSSLAYFARMREDWTAMLAFAEDMLARFMNNLPADYRNRPLNQQPDRVWGERVLPHFRDTKMSLDEDYIRLQNGDLSGLLSVISVRGDQRGQRADYPFDWMNEVYPGAADDFGKLYDIRGENMIYHTALASWSRHSLTNHYFGYSDGTLDYKGPTDEPLDTPATWPTYGLNLKVQIKTDEAILQTGIYLPDIEYGCAQLLIKSRDDSPNLAPEAEARTYEEYDGKNSISYHPTTWTLIERIADSGGGIPGQEVASANLQSTRIRVEGGQTCPEAGWYFTPVQNDSRRYFDKSVVMPSLAGDYGVTIWQWDANQEDSAASGSKLSAKTGQICPQDGLWTLAQRPDVIASVYDGTEMPSFEGQNVTWVYLRPRS